MCVFHVFLDWLFDVSENFYFVVEGSLNESRVCLCMLIAFIFLFDLITQICLFILFCVCVCSGKTPSHHEFPCRHQHACLQNQPERICYYCSQIKI